MRPLCLVESRSQDAAANAGVLSVYLATILYYHHQLFINIERDKTLYLFTCFIVRSTHYNQPVLMVASIWFDYKNTYNTV